MRDFTELQRAWFKDRDGVPEGINNHKELVKACEHNPESRVTGVTNRDYCPRCGKVLGQTLTQYKYNE